MTPCIFMLTDILFDIYMTYQVTVAIPDADNTKDKHNRVCKSLIQLLL